MLKSTVWTYRDKKKVFIQVDRFYVANSKKELDNIIFALTDIDAVTHPTLPDNVEYPIYLELENLSFGPSLTWVEKSVVQKAITETEKSLLKIKGKLM